MNPSHLPFRSLCALAAVVAIPLAVAQGLGAPISSAQAAARAPIEPEVPVPFGYKCQWLAFKGTTSQAVAQVLGLREVAPSGWERGIAAAYEGQYFVSPPVKGWVLAVSTSLPDAGGDGRPNRAAALVKRLSKEMGCTVHYYGSERVVEYHAWIWAEKGNIRRGFGYVGEGGYFSMNQGTPTPVERSRKLVFKDEDDMVAQDRIVNEEDVMAVAAAWSLDPMAFNGSHEKLGLGLLGKGR